MLWAYIHWLLNILDINLSYFIKMQQTFFSPKFQSIQSLKFRSNLVVHWSSSVPLPLPKGAKPKFWKFQKGGDIKNKRGNQTFKIEFRDRKGQKWRLYKQISINSLKKFAPCLNGSELFLQWNLCYIKKTIIFKILSRTEFWN